MFSYSQRYISTGKAKTISLFHETCGHTDVPIATLSARNAVEHKHLIPLRSVYLQFFEDPSEASFVDAVFEGDLSYWKTLSSSQAIEPYVAEWRDTAEVLRKSQAFKVIAKELNDPDSKNKFAAAKYLIEEPWKPKRTVAARKANQKKTQAAFELSQAQEDAERLRDQGYLL